MDNSIYSNKSFWGDKTLVIVPHEDDEINLCGGVLASVRKSLTEVYVAFVTNGDAFEKATTRHKEALRSLHRLGVAKENVFFLGYPDQLFDGEDYISNNDFSWISPKGRRETYGTRYADDFHYMLTGNHNAINRKNLICDIKLLIKRIYPQVIFCVDFDSHEDHRHVSLAFEYALGELLNEEKNYLPYVFKGFAYPTAYKGIPDFDMGEYSTLFLTEEFQMHKLQNPFFLWEDRIRFPICKGARRRCILGNVIFYALSAHRSQLILSKYKSIINMDQIFWSRRTDNLLRYASIETSSGESKRLNDFVLFDCSNISNGAFEEPRFDAGYWQPDYDDDECSVFVSFDKLYTFNSISIYQSPDNFAMIKGMVVKFDFDTEIRFEFTNELKQTFSFEDISTKFFSIQFISQNPSDIRITEIEVLWRKERPIQMLKIMVDDDFVYRISDNQINNIRIYGFDGIESRQISPQVVEPMKKIENKHEMLKIGIKDDIFDAIPIYAKQRNSNVATILNPLVSFLFYCAARVMRKLRNVIYSLPILRERP